LRILPLYVLDTGQLLEVSLQYGVRYDGSENCGTAGVTVQEYRRMGTTAHRPGKVVLRDSQRDYF
jgi:hypothetical protein